MSSILVPISIKTGQYVICTAYIGVPPSFGICQSLSPVIPNEFTTHVSVESIMSYLSELRPQFQKEKASTHSLHTNCDPNTIHASISYPKWYLGPIRTWCRWFEIKLIWSWNFVWTCNLDFSSCVFFLINMKTNNLWKLSKNFPTFMLSYQMSKSYS